MSTTVSNPPPSPPVSASVPTQQTRSFTNTSSTMLQRSNAAADGDVFAQTLSTLERSFEADSLPEDKGLPAHVADEQSGNQSSSPTRSDSNSQSDSGEESDDHPEPDNSDGSASLSVLAVNPAGLTAASAAAGGGLLVSMAGGEASLHGALSASKVATLMESLQARNLAAGTATTFRLVDPGFGLTSMQLARHVNGAWQIQLNAERSSRENMKRALDDLEAGLIARGHRIDRIELLDGSADDR